MRNVVCLLVLGLMVLIVVRPRTDDSREGTQLVEERDSSVTVMKGLERGLDSRVGDEEDLGVDMTVKFDEREQPSLSELLAGYDKRRELVSRVCDQQRDDLEDRWEDGVGEDATIKTVSKVQDPLARQRLGGSAGHG